jgi:hypothetical protein
MRSRIIFFSLLFMFGSGMAKAQRPPIKWGKILPADTSLKVYKQDTAASAVVLCDYGTVDVAPRTEYTRHVRIKILNNNGLRYAKVEIPYRYYEYYDVITELKAHTINVSPEGKMTVSRVKARNIEDVLTDRWNKKKIFSFPDVKPGSIIEYKYTIRSLDMVNLHNWYFQSTIPTLWSEYRVYISPRFDYLVTFQKGRALDNDEQKAFADRLQWLYDNRLKKVRRELMDKKYVLYESPKGTAKVYYAQGESFRFTMNDIPALKPQRSMLAFSDFYPAVKVHMYYADGYLPFFYRRILATAKEDYDWSNPLAEYLHYYRGFIAYWLPTWDEAVENWLSSDLFGNRLSKGADAKPVLETLSDPAGNQLNTIKNIYRYVKDNIQWDGTYSMYAYRSLNNVLNKKNGNSGEVNLLLISLLRQAGIKVDPVLIRTLDVGRIENVYPAFGQFNHVIAQVESGGQTLYLDATGRNSSFADLPWNVNHANGFVVNKNNYKWVEVVKTTQKFVVPAGYTKEI